MLAYAQLLRLPNVFTAFADILLAACVVNRFDESLALLLAASGCLYLAGMVFNDLFDRHEDAKTRPQRPLPSGRVSVRTAIMIAIVLLLAGLGFAVLADVLPIALALAALILLYDAWLKHTPLGPIAMGGCRSLNILLGVGNFEPVSLHLAAITGIYIAGVTWFARTEEGPSRKSHLRAAALVMAAAMILAELLPWHVAPHVPFAFPYLVVAFSVFVAVKLLAAIRSPGPREVQAAVKRSILGLIILDAVLATLWVGWPGLLIALLLLPARWLGRWVYST